MSLTAVERGHILAALKQSKWKLEGPDGAAGVLNLNPSTLRSRMKKLGITRPASRDI
jgi:transcriptional regulator with GAF, ATPase, and Fis domain